MGSCFSIEEDESEPRQPHNKPGSFFLSSFFGGYFDCFVICPDTECKLKLFSAYV